MAARPNILFLVADQMRFDVLGAVNSAIRTPNLDRLAARGMLVERAYAPTPVCLPCRASMVTGQWPSTHGATHNTCSLDPEHPVLVGRTFRDAGYFTHFVGKSHLNSCHDPLSPEGPGQIFRREFYRGWHGPWYGFERADLSIGHTTEGHAAGMHYGQWLVDVDRHFGNTEYTAYGAWDLPEEFHNSRWCADTVIAGVDRALDQERPFFINANFQDPHNPCMVPEPWASMYDPDAIPEFGFKDGEPECFADKPAYYREMLAQPGPYLTKPSDPGLPGTGNVCHLDWDRGKIQGCAAAYYGMVSLLDLHVGRILDHLEERGVADDTIVVFTADHGDLLGDHGLWFKSLVPYDESIRLPFLVSYPRAIPAGVRSEAFLSLVDLFPTCCHYAGIEVPHLAEGVDQHPAWEDPAVRVREDCIVEERPADTEWCQRILITDEHKCVFFAHRDEGELYDWRDDPHLTRNRWDDPDARELRERCVRRILTHEITKRRPNPTYTRLP